MWLSSESLEAQIFSVCGANDAITSRRHVFTHPRSFLFVLLAQWPAHRLSQIRDRSQPSTLHIYLYYVSMVVDYYFLYYVMLYESWRVRMLKKKCIKKINKKASRSTRLFIILCISLRPCSRQTMVCWILLLCGCMIVAWVSIYAICELRSLLL